MKLFAIILLPALLLVLLQKVSIQQPLRAGDAVPEQILNTTLPGNHTLRDFCSPGAVVIFFSAGCWRCTGELTNMKELQRALGSRIQFLLITSSNRLVAQLMIDSLGVGIPVVTDEDGSLRRAFGAYTVPAIFLVDRTGTVWQTSFSERPLEVRKRQLEEFVRFVTPATSAHHNPQGIGHDIAK